MKCASCATSDLTEFPAEINIHLPVRLNKGGILVFPKLFVCLECGFSHLTVPETALKVLREGQHRPRKAM